MDQLDIVYNLLLPFILLYYLGRGIWQCIKGISYLCDDPQSRIPKCMGQCSNFCTKMLCGCVGCTIFAMGLIFSVFIIADIKANDSWRFETYSGEIYYQNTTENPTIYDNSFYCSYYAISIDCENRTTLSCNPQTYSGYDYKDKYISIDRTTKTSMHASKFYLFSSILHSNSSFFAFKILYFTFKFLDFELKPWFFWFCIKIIDRDFICWLCPINSLILFILYILYFSQPTYKNPDSWCWKQIHHFALTFLVFSFCWENLPFTYF